MKLYDLVIEVYHSIKKHKTRNILTGFGISWGVLILMVLLSAGEGLYQGVQKLFSSFAQNSLWIYAGQTSQRGESIVIGESIQFREETIQGIIRKFGQIKHLTSQVDYGRSVIISNESENTYGTLRGVGQQYFHIKILKLQEGRLFNSLDYQRERAVCVIGHSIAKQLSRKNGQSLIGEIVNVSGEVLKVIGILDQGSLFTQGEHNSIYVPYDTYQNKFESKDFFDVIVLSLHDTTNAGAFEKHLRRHLAEELNFNVDDSKALYVANIEDDVNLFNKLFSGVQVFILFMGGGLLLSGVIGIGNMMSTAVKERTQEIGIRKALGAKPSNILQMVLLESIIVSLFSGIIGMLFGGIITFFGNIYLSMLGDAYVIESMIVDYMAISQALLLLIIAGCLAGLVPARRASKIVPVKALNHTG